MVSFCIFKCSYLRRFGFVQFEDPADAAEAKDHMDGYVLLGRKMAVEFAENNRKTPTAMRAKQRGDGRCFWSFSLSFLNFYVYQLNFKSFNILFVFVGALGFGIEGVVPLITPLARLCLLVLLLLIEDVTQGLCLNSTTHLCGQ